MTSGYGVVIIPDQWKELITRLDTIIHLLEQSTVKEEREKDKKVD